MISVLSLWLGVSVVRFQRLQFPSRSNPELWPGRETGPQQGGDRATTGELPSWAPAAYLLADLLRPFWARASTQPGFPRKTRLIASDYRVAKLRAKDERLARGGDAETDVLPVNRQDSHADIVADNDLFPQTTG